MYSFLPETAKCSTLLNSDILLTPLLKISFVIMILYLTGIGYSKTGLFSRVKRFKNLVELVNKYPGLNYYPIFGSTPEMVNLVVQPCRDFFPWMQKMAQSCGPAFRFWLFNQPKLIITCSETAIACLKEDSFPCRTSESVENAKKIGGEGLIALAPDVHGPRKKIWKQWFTRRIINGNLEIIQKEAIRITEKLSTKTDKTFDFVDDALHCTFRTIACSAFGEEYVNSIPEADIDQHFHGLTTICIRLFNRIFRPWLANDFLYYNLTTDGRQTMRCVKKAHKLTLDAIKHGKTLRLNKFSKMDNTSSTPYFLDHLLDIHEQGDLTENEVFQELNNFMVGGYDTTGLSISWTLYLLALHPECQTKIYDELYQIFDGNLEKFSSKVSAGQLQDMRYLELCIKESLRLYPAFAIILRRSADGKSVVMPDGNIIPDGVDVCIPLRIIHQDLKYFPEPKSFIPERHLESIPAYIPFGKGSRNCIGQVYAMQEMKMILAYLLMKYKWVTLEKPGLEPLMVPLSYPENGIRFKISKRNNP